MVNKNDLILKHFHRASELTFKNKAYQKIVHDLIVWLLENDQVGKDITSKLLLGKSKTVSAHIVSKQPLTVAGIEEIKYLLKTFTKISFKVVSKDGEKIEAKKTIIKLTGDVKEILAFERVMLNLLQTMSGIATETRSVIDLIKYDKPYIAATRKTPWGLLDKKAVALGGGLTHRLNLSDGILVKDNHFLLLPTTAILQKLLDKTENMLIEIEVEDEKSLLELINSFSRSKTNNTLAVLLDNFSPLEAREILSKYNLHKTVIFEASGGITAENINEWTNSGVDVISLGALTHSSKAADISLDLVI